MSSSEVATKCYARFGKASERNVDTQPALDTRSASGTMFLIDRSTNTANEIGNTQAPG
jgi:hypothetical protein